jgi:hypothetical protein
MDGALCRLISDSTSRPYSADNQEQSDDDTGFFGRPADR